MVKVSGDKTKAPGGFTTASYKVCRRGRACLNLNCVTTFIFLLRLSSFCTSRVVCGLCWHRQSTKVFTQSGSSDCQRVWSTQ